MLRFLLYRLIWFYEILIVADCILSWFPTGEGTLLADLRSVLNRLVGPYLDLFRRIIPAMPGIDFTPMIGILVLELIARVLL